MSPRTRSLLDQARRQAAPRPEDLARVRSRLMAGITASSPTRAATAVSLSLLRSIGAGALVALAGLAAWQTVVGRGGEALAAPQAEALVCPPPPSCAPAEPWWTPAPAEPPARCASPTPGALAQASGNEVAALGKRDAHRATLYSVPLSEQNRLDVELGLLLDARVALDEGRLLDALGHVQRHEQLFEHTAFEEERLALAVLTYCAMGRVELAEPRLQRLVELAPQSTYLPRVQASCGELTMPNAGEEHEDE